jgi:hypothetical protein
LDVYCSAKDENYKKWLEEITPFKDFYPHKNLLWKAYFYILRYLIKLSLFKSMFLYNWTVFIIEQPDEDEIFLRWSINGLNKIFFKIKKWKSIFIDKIISLEKWLWRKSIKELCEYYNIYDIVVEPSIYGIWFWKKMKKEYKWRINILIN